MNHRKPYSSSTRLKPRIFYFWAMLAACYALAAVGKEPADFDYALRRWTTDQGLPQNAVTAIVQSRDGYLWLGTYVGLVRFDGVNFKVFDSETCPAMVNNRITKLYESPDGALWISHETGEVTRYFHGVFEAIKLPPSIHDNEALTIGADERGDIWLLDNYNVLVRLKDGKTIRTIESRIKTVDIMRTARDGQGNLWIGQPTGIGYLHQGQVVPVQPDPLKTNAYFRAICPSRAGGIWVICDNRLRRLDHGHWVQEIKVDAKMLGGVVALLELANGKIVIGNWNLGVYLANPDGTFQRFSKANGLAADWIRAFCEDREGNVWLGDAANGGLIQLRQVNFHELTPPDHWEGKRLTSVCAPAPAELWVGTEGAGLYRWFQGAWNHYCYDDSEFPEGLTPKFVWSVNADRQRRVWVGSWGGGLLTWTNGTFQLVPGFAPSLEISALFEGGNGVVWIGTRTGLIRYEHGRQVHYGEAEGLVHPDVRAIAQAPDGTLWFGMADGGLGSLRDGKLRQYRKGDGLDSDFVQCLRAESDGSLWLGTLGGGLARLKDGRFRRVSRAEGLANNSIGDIQDDGLGYWWLASQAGVLRVSKEELENCCDGLTNRVNCVSYGVADGLPSKECSNGCQPVSGRDADGHLYFPTQRGLASVDPAHLHVNPVLPPVLIQGLLVDDEPVTRGTNRMDVSRPLRIAPGQHRYEFSYTALSFSAPEKVRFNYHLAGWDKKDVKTANRYAIYGNLPPGHYRFEVTACNNDGRWNTQGAQLNFIVLPYFWQTWWFRFLVYLAAAVTIAGAVWLVARRRHRRKIERLERQRELERERMRIANDIHDDLGASLTRIMMLSQPQGESDAPPASPSQLDRIFDTASELTTAVDEIVWAVNPRHDTLDSLANYLTHYAQEFLSPAGLRCRIEMPLGLPSWGISAEWRHNVFVAFKEVLNNIVKHAAATQVSISLTVVENHFRLTVTDDGRGFSPEAAAAAGRPVRGNGLRSLQQRLQKLGGTCQFQARPGAGTTVIFDLSLPPQRK